MIRELFVEGVAQIPAVGQVEAGRRDELARGADPFEEHDQLQLEKDDRVDARPSSVSIEIVDPFTDEAKIELRLKAAVEIARGNELVQRDG